MDTHKLYSWLRRHDSINASVHRDGEEESLLRQPLLRDMDDQLAHAPHDARLLPDADDDAQDLHARLPLSDQRAATQRQMPPSLAMFAGKQSFIRDGLYTYLDSSGHAQRAKRNKPSKKYMLPILDNLRRLDALLDAPFNLADEDNIQACFHAIILSCENYLDNRNPWTREGKARKQMIQDFYEQVKYESVGFAGIVDNLRRGAAVGAAPQTWIDVISQVRTQTFEDGRDGVKITEGGAGTSTLYIVEKNGVKRYFKQNETVPQGHYHELLGIEKERLRREDELFQASGHSDAEKSAHRRRTSARTAALDAVTQCLFEFLMHNEGYVYRYLCEHADKNDLLKTIISDLSIYPDFTNAFDEMITERIDLAHDLDLIRGRYEAETDDTAKEAIEQRYIAKKKEYDDCDLEYIHSVLIQIKKDMLAHLIAVEDAAIAPASELSKRNVATSRMAKMLGLDSMIVGSKMAEVLINGKRMRGIIMDEAPGTDAVAIAKSHARPITYSAKAFRQILNLQVFDIICGQVDRHMGNYVCREDSRHNPVELSDIMGIDHDMSFGNLTYAEILQYGSDGLNRMRNIELDGDLTLPFIDYDLYTRVMHITQEQINYEMCDILTKEERKALFDRIKGVQRAFEKRMKYERKNCRKPKFVCRIIGNPAIPKTWDTAHSDYVQAINDARIKCVMKADTTKQTALQKLAEKRAKMSPDEYNLARQQIMQSYDEDKDEVDSSLSCISYLYGPFLSGTKVVFN